MRQLRFATVAHIDLRNIGGQVMPGLWQQDKNAFKGLQSRSWRAQAFASPLLFGQSGLGPAPEHRA